MAVTKMEFLVIKANICGEDGKKVLVGQRVTLGKKYATHYKKLGYIEMPMPDMDDEPEAATADDIAEEFVPVDRAGRPMNKEDDDEPTAASEPSAEGDSPKTESGLKPTPRRRRNSSL